MRLFKSKDPAATLAADIATARDQRDRLTARLHDATARAASAKEHVADLLGTDADDAALTKAESAHRAAEDAIAHRSDALAAAEAKLHALEQQQRDLIDAQQREQSIAQVGKDRAALSEAQATFDKACAKFLDVAQRVSPYTPECLELVHFMRQAPNTIGMVLEMVHRGADGWVSLIQSGAAPAVLPTVEAPTAPIVLPPQPPMVELVATHHLCWTDDNGNLRTSPRGHRVLLPAALAEHAVALTAAATFGSDAAKRALAGQHPSIVSSLSTLR